MLTDGQTNSLTPFHLERVLLWQFNVASNHATYLDLQVPDFNQIWIFSMGSHRSVRIYIFMEIQQAEQR
jgi:hypothetical protein